MQLSIKRSLADEKSLNKMMVEAYGLRFIDVQLVNARENDVYKLYTKSNIYLLKIYPLNKIDESRLEFIERVSFKAYGDNYILRTLAGKLMYSISFPEGQRVAVLYNFISNREATTSHQLYYNYGEELARFHSLNIAPSPLKKLAYNDYENIIIDACLNNEIKHQLFELMSIVEAFSKSKLSKLSVGLCHGDCHIENAVITETGIRLIDLDSIKEDYHLSDIGSMFWANYYGMGVSEANLDDFLKGYTSHNKLNGLTHENLIYFLLYKELTYILGYVERQSYIGIAFVNSSLVANRLLKLQNLIKKSKFTVGLKYIQ